jgi:hypothetical protein
MLPATWVPFMAQLTLAGISKSSPSVTAPNLQLGSAGRGVTPPPGGGAVPPGIASEAHWSSALPCTTLRPPRGAGVFSLHCRVAVDLVPLDHHAARVLERLQVEVERMVGPFFF